MSQILIITGQYCVPSFLHNIRVNRAGSLCALWLAISWSLNLTFWLLFKNRRVGGYWVPTEKVTTLQFFMQCVDLKTMGGAPPLLLLLLLDGLLPSSQPRQLSFTASSGRPAVLHTRGVLLLLLFLLLLLSWCPHSLLKVGESPLVLSHCEGALEAI